MSINSVGYWSRLDKQSTDLQPVVDQQAINNITVNADQYKDNWVGCYKKSIVMPLILVILDDIDWEYLNSGALVNTPHQSNA